MLKNTNNGLPIKFGVIETSYGWLDLKVMFDDNEFTMHMSELGCGLAALVDCLYYLYPDLGHDEYNFRNVEYGSCEGPAGSENPDVIVTWENVPWKTEILFEEEGSSYTWALSRNISLDTDFMVDIKIEYSGSVENKEYKFSVRYKDLCYAVAKVCTETLKKYGLGGYQDNSWDNDINLRRLIFIKAIALDKLKEISSVWDHNEAKSDFANEISILIMDM